MTRATYTDDGRTDSAEFKHDDTCNMFNPHHTIPNEVAEVVEALRDLPGFNAVAGGCNGCTAPVLDYGVYYIAQHGEPDTVYFGYSDKVAAHTLVGVCDDLGVPCDWTGDVSKKVAVGTDDAY